VDVNLTDGQAHQLALYLLDWDSGVRQERIDFLDAQSGAVLASQNASNFGGGAYLVFNASGHGRISVTCLAGANAVLSGPFFAPVDSGNGSLTASLGNGGGVSEGSAGTVSFTGVSGGSSGYTYSYDFNNDGTFEISGSPSASATVPASYLDDGPGARVVHGR